MYDLLNSFIVFINLLFDFKIIGNVSVYHIFLFFVIIGGIFLLINKLLGGKEEKWYDRKIL